MVDIFTGPSSRFQLVSRAVADSPDPERPALFVLGPLHILGLRIDFYQSR